MINLIKFNTLLNIKYLNLPCFQTYSSRFVDGNFHF